MKRVLALLLCVILAVTVFAACDQTNEDAHVHTYSDEFTGDGTGHWYEPTCDCTDAPYNKLNHVDANNDGACDFCKFTDHTHTYSEDWTADCTNHWNAASCGHVVAGTNVAAHADENGDGKCDVCAYVIEDLHVHIYGNEYTTDEGYHWYAPICEHSDAEVTKEAHTVNAAGECTVCGAKINEVDKTDILAMINAAIANNHKVTGGNVVANELVYDANEVLGIGKIDEIYFMLGDEQSYVFYKSFDTNENFLGAEHQWYERVTEDEIFSVIMYVDSYKLQRNSGDAQFLYGYTYLPGGLLSASEDTSTLSVTVSELYALANSANAKDLVVKYDETTGLYAFAYTYVQVHVTEGSDGAGNAVVDYAVELYDVAVAFTVDENYVIDYARITVDSYRNLEGVDNDFDYNPETGDITFRPEKSATTYDYVVNQTSGERTYINPYTQEALTPEKFELYNCETVWSDDLPPVLLITNKEHIGDTVTIESNKNIYFYLDDLYPVSSYATFINEFDIVVSYVNNDENSDGELWSSFGPYFSTYEGYIGFYSKDAGTYTVTVQYFDFVKTFTVVVTAPDAGDEELGDNEFAVQTTDTYVYEDLVTFVATNGSGKYTFTLPAGLGYCTIDGYNNYAPEHDVFAGGSVAEVEYTFSVDLAANAEYKFYVGATSKGSWVISYTYEAGEVSGDDNGGDVGGDTPSDNYNTVIAAGANTLYFSAAEVSANAAERALVIAVDGIYQFPSSNLFIAGILDADGNSIAKNADHTFALTAGNYTVQFGMLSMLGVRADAPYGLTVENMTAEGGDDVGGGDVGGGDVGGDEGDDTNEPDGTEENPFVIDDGSEVFVFANQTSPVYVLVNAGVTANLTFDGYFMIDTEVCGTTVTPVEDTLYAVYANSMAGASGFIIGGTDVGGDEGGEEAPEAALVGFYNVDGYEAMIVYNAETDTYLFNIWGMKNEENFDNTYVFVAVFNDDGTATLTLTFVEGYWMNSGANDALAINGTDVTVTVPTSDEGGEEAPEAALEGLHNIDGYDALIYFDYNYEVYILNIWGEKDGVGFDSYYTFVATFNYDGTATLALTFFEYPDTTDALELNGTDVTVTVPTSDEGGDEGGEEAPEAALEGFYNVDGYDALIYFDYTYEVYVLNIWVVMVGVVFVCFFSFVATFNYDGTATLALTFIEYPDTTDALELNGTDVTVTVPTSDEGGDEGGEEAPEAALEGLHNIDGYDALIYFDYTYEVYVLNIWGEKDGVGFDSYYTFIATFNYDGTATLALMFLEYPDTTDALELNGTDVTVTVSTSDEGGDEGGEAAPEAALEGFYNVDGYEAMIFYNVETEIYLFNIWGAKDAENFDNTYVFVAVFNDDGTATLTLTFVEGYWSNTGANDALALDGKDITITLNVNNEAGDNGVTSYIPLG